MLVPAQSVRHVAPRSQVRCVLHLPTPSSHPIPSHPVRRLVTHPSTQRPTTESNALEEVRVCARLALLVSVVPLLTRLVCKTPNDHLFTHTCVFDHLRSHATLLLGREACRATRRRLCELLLALVVLLASLRTCKLQVLGVWTERRCVNVAALDLRTATSRHHPARHISH